MAVVTVSVVGVSPTQIVWSAVMVPPISSEVTFLITVEEVTVLLQFGVLASLLNQVVCVRVVVKE